MANKAVIREGEPGYQRCTVTIMDTTDPLIRFNGEGVSNWVDYYREKVLPSWRSEGDPPAYQKLIGQIKRDGVGREYDCLLGLSGGVDSSYLAYLAWKAGLRCLVIHTDTGWNTELAVSNVEQVVKRCGFDLHTHVIDWEEMADLQRAFLRAGVPNQDIPQDHAIFAAFYGFAVRNRVKWVLSGHNFACESVLPGSWGHGALDLRHIRAIHRQYGERPLGRFPRMGPIKYGVVYKGLLGLKVAKPLDLVHYERRTAIEVLEQEFGWRNYGAKHFESRWTRFFQGWWLPNRFGYDKRLAHLSSMILSGQLTRNEALSEIKSVSYPDELMADDRRFVLKKLHLSEAELEALFRMPIREHASYPTGEAVLRWLLRIGTALGRGRPDSRGRESGK